MSNSLVKWDAYFQIASQSDIGMRRTNNQDNLFVSLASTVEQWQRRGHLFLVADGMGAHAAGELASKIAVDQIPHLYAKYGGQNPADSLRRAIADANSEIHRRGQANEEFYNMGTTCSALLLLPEGIFCGHVGDSRVYRLRKDRMQQLTFDHSLVWEMRAAGQVTDKEELANIPKNYITRSLGPYPEIKVDIEGPFPVQADDVFMLCSDGLTGQLTDQEIGAILAHLEPTAAAQLLVDVANLRGGPDNITLIIVKVVDGTLMESAAGVTRKPAGGATAKIHPLSWVALIVSVLVTALFYFVTQSWAGAAVPAAVAAIALIWFLAQLVMVLNSSGGEQQPDRYGRGPYVTEDIAQFGWPLVKNFKEMIGQISAAGRTSRWTIDQAQLETLADKAVAAETAKDLPGTIRGYGRVVSFLMEQLRHQGGSTEIDV